MLAHEVLLLIINLTNRNPARKEADQVQKDELIDREIAEHGRTWCIADCRTFLPVIYRMFRRRGCSPASMQTIPTSCHAEESP